MRLICLCRPPGAVPERDGVAAMSLRRFGAVAVSRWIRVGLASSPSLGADDGEDPTAAR